IRLVNRPRWVCSWIYWERCLRGGIKTASIPGGSSNIVLVPRCCGSDQILPIGGRGADRGGSNSRGIRSVSAIGSSECRKRLGCLEVRDSRLRIFEIFGHREIFLGEQSVSQVPRVRDFEAHVVSELALDRKVNRVGVRTFD